MNPEYKRKCILFLTLLLSGNLLNGCVAFAQETDQDFYFTLEESVQGSREEQNGPNASDKIEGQDNIKQPSEIKEPIKEISVRFLEKDPPQDASPHLAADRIFGNLFSACTWKGLKDAAESRKGNLAGMVEISLYYIDENAIRAVRYAAHSEEVTFTLPKEQTKAGRRWSLLCMVDGEIMEMVDKDTAPDTLTVDLSRFGLYVLIWRQQIP